MLFCTFYAFCFVKLKQNIFFLLDNKGFIIFAPINT